MSDLAQNPLPPNGFETLTFGGYATKSDAIIGAGFWHRAGARLIDFILHYLITYFSGYLFSQMLLLSSGGHVPHSVVLKLLRFSIYPFLLALVGDIAYHTICEGLHGATLGKRLLSLVVVQEDRTVCRPVPALVRSLAYFVDSLFFGLIGYFSMTKTPQEQRHGDVWAHTVVCSRENAPPGVLRSDAQFVVVLLLGIMADSACLIAGLLFKVVG